ncbi:class I SAM-dependent methyltransferase [Paenarthrobacter sp. NPDC057981]|uniref:class I SAM-dependent methyltransferase n=1 Tax=Paenarthrobacter sp. NPDC057981 TaxID=3346297 RepID=UPI0036DED84F
MTTTPERDTDPVLQTLEGTELPVVQRDVHGFRLYDRLIANQPTEIPEILAAARQTSGSILELAPGSGRFTRSLNPLGREVSAVELNLPESQPEDTYGCVILGSSYATLLESHRRRLLFRFANRCLASDGLFLMTVLNADHRYEPGSTNSGATISQLDQDSFLVTVERRDALNGARHVSLSHISFNEHGTYRSSEYTSDIAFVSTELIEEELNAEGLSVLERRPIKVDPETAGIEALNLWVCARNQQGQTEVKDRP